MVNLSNGSTLQIGSPSEFSRSVTLAQQAYDIIEEMIVTGKILPGQTVSEISLSKQLDLGRTPIREALQRLATNQIVAIRPRRGATVSDIGENQARFLLEVRRPLDRLVARFAARKANARHQAALKEGAESMMIAARTGNNAAVVSIDAKMKKCAVEASDNAYLAAAVGPLHSLGRRLYFYATAVAPRREVAEAHAALYLAIAEGDEENSVANVDIVLDLIEKVYQERQQV